MTLLPRLVLATTLALPAVADAAPAEPYLDDRSTPEALVQSFYNAIGQQQYARAWGYFTPGRTPGDFAAWAAGYGETVSVAVRFGPTAPDPGAGQITWALPVAIAALGRDGATTVYAGCYRIHLANPAIQTDPPFQPMSIDGASLQRSSRPVDAALPGGC